jgi:hypothetical protein
MMVLAPFGVIATLLSSYLGYSIWRAGARPDQYRLERLLVTQSGRSFISQGLIDGASEYH